MSSVNPSPATIPALREWVGQTGTYILTDTTRLVVDKAKAPELISIAQTLQDDLQRITSRFIEIVTAPSPDQTDIFLSLECTEHTIGDQGYLLDITDRVIIHANTVTGVYYGTQTLLQILQQAPDHWSLAKGRVCDYPRFSHRAIMLDAGRRYWQMSYLHDLMQHMARLKLNVLHLHFNDWNAFRLQSDLHPGLAAPQAYSKADITQLQKWANRYHITLVPEIDLPSHATAITRYDPSLAFDCDSMSRARWPGGESGGWTINYADPKARQWMKDLLSEFIPLFDGPHFHIGTDEVPDGDAPAQCPQLVQYAQVKGYTYPGDVLVAWINEMNDLVRSFGKQMQIWSWWERSPHSISPDKDIIVNAWVEAGTSEGFLEAGYQVIHSAEDTLYLTPSLDLFPNEEYLYNEWILSEHPNSIGYKICVWADNGEGQPDAFYEEKLHHSRAILAKRTWCGERSPKPYEDFINGLRKLGV